MDEAQQATPRPPPPLTTVANYSRIIQIKKFCLPPTPFFWISVFRFSPPLNFWKVLK
nr:MAG TPA: hypothetical protein [Caudoviricetes sp.]